MGVTLPKETLDWSMNETVDTQEILWVEPEVTGIILF